MSESAIDIPDDNEDVRSAQREALLERLEKTPTCMLITHDANGGMHVRPMTTQQVEAPGTLWMFISAKSHLATEVKANPAVLVTYADVGDSAYAAVRGHATIVRDIEKQHELWTTLAGAWFPGGAEDPDLALLRIAMSWAELWEPSAGKLLQFLEIAAAALTKSAPDTEGNYRRIDF